ncbi:hypothetical protein [Fischerella major]|uniref:hypothetical protein n=1 Tax=Fischerella major TaxID=210993 RepID=UPI00116141CD|nr:hypothetical protein [Fischerella major]
MRVSSWLLFVGGWWLVVKEPVNRVCTLVISSCLILTPHTPHTPHAPPLREAEEGASRHPSHSPSPYSRNTSGLIRLLQEVESSSHK